MLTNRYLKYSPEITLEIFELVFNKLIDSGWSYWLKTYTAAEVFKEYCKRGTIRDDGKNRYFAYVNIPEDLTEINVQEILGYDPFVKKEVIPEYVECIDESEGFTIGKIYKTDDTSSKNWYNFDSNDNGEHDGSFPKNFKPSTKEAFETQNKPKPIKKWSVGSCVVAIKDGTARAKPEDSFKIGFIDEIDSDFLDSTVGIKFSSNCCNKSDFEWFATKSEAEEFAEALVEPVKHGNGILDVMEKNHPLKQAVHCKTQEEWDFVSEKLGYKWSERSKWSSYKNNTCINLNELGFGTADVAYKGYQILSFQEWCDLNGYEMEKEVRHATPEEVNNHLIYIGQIPAGDPVNMGLMPNEDGGYGFTNKSTSKEAKKPILSLSIDDEELSLPSVKKVKTINY